MATHIKVGLTLSVVALFLNLGCRRNVHHYRPGEKPPAATFRALPANASPELQQVVAAAIDQVGVTTAYDPTYIKLDYPNGDVPEDRGVCSDVIVRAFRKGGIDLQKEVHEDMAQAWSAYPRKWGTSARDANIDHRRVLNLMVYFQRQGKALPLTSNASDYVPGDVVCWDLGSGLDHIGIVSNAWIASQDRYLIVHNVGLGTRAEDVLFNWKITGHYRYFK